MRKRGIALHTETPVGELKNLAQAATVALNRIGIYTYGDLQATGAFSAWQQLRANGTRWNIVGLYALSGALLDCHWNKLPDELKLKLQKQAKEAR